MYLECGGSGSPTVVLIAGLKGLVEDWNIADKQSPTVFAEVAKFTRVCGYDRPGTPVGEKPSRSDPVPQPTTAGDAVADLDALLRAAKEATPYVMVGHSYGGLVARLYASTYPDDVSGLVLVDALTERLQDAVTPEQWAVQRVLMEGDITESLALYPDLERIDPERSFDQIRAAPKLRPSVGRGRCTGGFCRGGRPTGGCHPACQANQRCACPPWDTQCINSVFGQCADLRRPGGGAGGGGGGGGGGGSGTGSPPRLRWTWKVKARRRVRNRL
jgi:pimeloyl-ACP methyl ester carboxylesterase